MCVFSLDSSGPTASGKSFVLLCIGMTHDDDSREELPGHRMRCLELVGRTAKTSL